MSSHSKSSAFTLIELVLAISILSIVLTTAYGTIHSVIRARDVINDNRESTAIANAILSRVVREIQLAVVDKDNPLLLNLGNPTGSKKTVAELLGETDKLSSGEYGDSITFKASEGGQYLPDGGGHSGVVQISYRLEDNPELKSEASAPKILVRDEVPLISPAKKAYAHAMTFPISASVIGLSFQYYDAQQEKWLTTWGEEQSGRLPYLIHIEVATQSPNGKIERYRTTVFVRGKI